MYFATNTNGLVGTFMIVWALGMMVVTIGLVLFGLSLHHALTHKDITNRSLWLVVIFIPILGSALYFMQVLVPYNRTHPYVAPKKS